jgi:iron(III) transport system substrate-binding protein
MTGMRYRLLLTVLPAMLMLAGAAPVCAQAPRAPEIAALQGADREQRLIEGARREKELTLYSSLPADDIAALVAAFDKRYGIKVKVWRGDSEGLLERVGREHKARRYEADVLLTASSALEALSRDNLLQDVRSPHLADIVSEGVGPQRQWVAAHLNVIVQAYNTHLVPRESLPRSFADLLRPQWRGRLGVEADDFDWFAQVVTGLEEAQGLRLFRDIVAANGVSVRKGHAALSGLVVSGEVPLGLTVYGFQAEQAKRKGAPLDWLVLGQPIARAGALGMARNAPRPHAAVLFYDFMLGEGQQILASRHFVPASRRIESPLRDTLKVIDSAAMLDQARKWQELYQRTIIGPSR